jgi:D-alanyl-D-alanine carboxypeptidase/D-alanyl-D-alanine-endopeptidase (penicillin-binding protein 4)
MALCLLPLVVQAAPQLPPEIAKVLQTHKIPAADLSLYVSKVTEDSPTLALNAASPRNPASVMKLVTSLMALDTLGPNFHWKTEAYIRGSLQQGVLDGDLILKGYGDPNLSPERFWQFLYGLRERGIRVIKGDLIIDGSYFAAPTEQRGDFDGKPQRAYNALPHPLSLNFQATQVHLVPDQGSATVHAFTYPPLANMEIRNQMKLVAGPCQGQRSNPVVHLAEQQAGATLELQGEYSSSCPEWSGNYLVMDPAEHVGGAFRALWKQLGGELKGRVREGLIPQQAKRFHSIESPPLAEVIRSMNKFSNNLISRMLLLTVAAEGRGAPADIAKGQDLVQDWLTSWQLPAGMVRVGNGSGLTRDGRISVEVLGRMLQGAYAGPLMPEYIASLPLAGIDGTMRKRLRKTDLVGRAHIKTGTLNGVSAMAGYVQDRNNQRWVVALIINHKGLQSWQGKQVQDAALRWVYQGPNRNSLGSGQIAAAEVKCEGRKKTGACKPLQ